MQRCGQFAASLALLAACVSIGPGQAKGLDSSPGIIGKDDREIVDSWDHPWAAVGQVNVSGYRMVSLCTGTLIAPNVVLTASHCLVDPWKHAPYPMHSVHFIAGVRRDKSLGHSTAKCIRFPNDYRFVGSEKDQPDARFQKLPIERFEKDIAIIVLSGNIPVRPVPLAKGGEFEDGLALTYAGYPADRRFLLSADRGCHLISRFEGIWATSCDSHPGSSGGPVFLEQEGEMRIGAVMVGAMERLLTLAVPVTDLGDISLDQPCSDAEQR